MILLTACAVDATSDVVRVRAHEHTETRSTNISLLHIKVVPVAAPWAPARSLELMDFAERTVARLPADPEFSDNWLTQLVDDFARFDD